MITGAMKMVYHNYFNKFMAFGLKNITFLHD